MRISLIPALPVLIILIGAGYLLANLGLIPITPWQAFVKYWPALLVLWGLRIIIWDTIMSRFRAHKANSLIYGVALTLIGLHLLIPRLGIEGFTVTWGFVWPVLLIALGIQILLNKKRRASNRFIVRSLSRNQTSWYVDDLYLNQFIGDITLDLTKAVIPNKEIFFEIHSSIGDLDIYIPSDLPLHAKCRVAIGDATILDRSDEGVGVALEVKTVDYDQADRKLNLIVSYRIGRVTVRRI
ncbi:MAG: cell wall-active antibiotics response protein LiaF [Limnochordia bacterium]